MFRVHWYAFWVAILVGCLVNVFGDWLFGVRIELFWGLETFNFLWFLELFIWPVVVGISVSYVYGLGGKWIAIFPPLIVRFAAYYQTVEYLGVPQGAQLMPLGWWGFFVILAMEAAMIGGVLGEIMNKRVYGWKKARHVSDADADINSEEKPVAVSTVTNNKVSASSQVSADKDADSGV